MQTKEILNREKSLYNRCWGCGIHSKLYIQWPNHNAIWLVNQLLFNVPVNLLEFWSLSSRDSGVWIDCASKFLKKLLNETTNYKKVGLNDPKAALKLLKDWKNSHQILKKLLSFESHLFWIIENTKIVCAI